MAQHEMLRMYNLSDADLKQKADSLLQTTKRDLFQFSSRNVNADTLRLLQEHIDNFANASTDEELLGQLKAATETKDETAAALRRLLRTIRNMAEIAFEGKGHFHSFGFDGMAKMSDTELCMLARRVSRIANRLLPDLVTQGLSASQLGNVLQLQEDLDRQLDRCAEAVENRDIETQERVRRGNVLYAEMMRVASIGKSLFEDTDEARYNDYVLIGSNTRTDTAETGVATA
jgi:hypothetical protein